MVRFRGLSPPRGASAPLYFASLLGFALVSASMGVLVMLAAVVTVKAPPPDRSALTDFGASIFIPEWDLVIYVFSVFASMVLAGGFALLWNRRLRSIAPAKAAGFLLGSLLLQVCAAVVGSALTVNQFLKSRAYSPISGGRLAAFAGIGAILMASALVGSAWRRPSRIAGRIDQVFERHADLRLPRLRFSVLDPVVPVGVVIMIYVVSWRNLAGRFFLEEGLFHWDYYAMSPTLAFRHGMDLGRQVTWMYGVGWPMVYSALFSWVPPSYGRMIQAGSVYACIYLSGIYLLLRLLVRRPVLAALGTGLVSLQFFVGMGGLNLWRYPSLTVMRSAFDVWCFVALMVHRRTGRRAWAGASGAFIGLAIAFSTDTGLHLSAAAGFYWLCILWMDEDSKERLKDILASVAAALVTLLLVLALAGRGRIFNAEFWRGWLALVIEFGGGFGQLPLATLPNTTTVATFVVPFFVYLAVIAYALARLLHRRAQHTDIFNACLAAYGLLLMVHFVGRSGDYTPIRLSIPLALILVGLAGRAYGHADLFITERLPAAGRAWTTLLLPGAVAAVAVAAAAITPRSLIVDPILNYPSPLTTALRGSPPEGRCVFLIPKDICGLPSQWERSEADFRRITGHLREIKSEGKTFAALDESGSTFYLAADTAPWGRFPRIFISLHTKQKLAEFVDSLRADPPDYVLTRMPLEEGSIHLERFPVAQFGLGPHPGTPFADVWAALRATVQELYTLNTTIAPYEIWRLKEPAPPSEGRE